jgi:hypothetical protein
MPPLYPTAAAQKQHGGGGGGLKGNYTDNRYGSSSCDTLDKQMRGGGVGSGGQEAEPFI